MIKAFQWDLARQVERLDVLLALLPKYADWGYRELYLHLEDAIEFPRLPEVARPDAYRYREMEKLVDAAHRVGVGVVPIVNLLGHTQYLIKTPGLRDLNELRDDKGRPLEKGQLCPLHDRTLEVAARLMDDIRPFCTAGKLHVGLDESFHLGKCPRCAAEIAEHGLPYHFSGYVGRLQRLTSERQLRLGMWADMLNFIPEAIPLLPKDIIAYDWYYYPFKRHPRVELFNFAEVDLATPLQARGIEYWGCPMDGAFRFEPMPLFKDRLANLRSWWDRCARVKAAGFLVTSWEAYRLALPLTTVVDAAASCLWNEPKKRDDQAMLSEGFARVFGPAGASRSARLALRADRYPFSGYAKWETNQRWDGLAGLNGRKATLREIDALRRLYRQTPATPAALKASLGLRLYFSQRDGFIENAAAGVFQLRNALAANKLKKCATVLHGLQSEAKAFRSMLGAGRSEARTMWRLSRKPGAESQNEQIFDADLERLNSWERWLKACIKRPALATEATLVCGAWQLVFTVVNFAPAAQRVVVDQQQEDGTWLEKAGRHTIEFQAIAAQRRSRVRRFFSLPLSRNDLPLRLRLDGVGQVKIEKIFLTNGVRTISIEKAGFLLGQAVPTSGLPDIYATREVKALTIKKAAG